MKTLVRFLFLSLALASIAVSPMRAQDSVGYAAPYAAQLSLVYPLGTGGLRSYQHSYVVSVNMLVGLTGATTCVGMGGIGNIDRRGTQGVSMAGIFNYAHSYATAAQLAGVSNYAGPDSANSVQVAGIVNLAQHSSKVQLAGVSNVSGGAAGAQLAGVSNYAHGAVGAQLAGIANVQPKGSAGTQLSGMVNVGDTVRMQAALVNVMHKGGFQLGLINVRDTADGKSLGMLNIVKRGGVFDVELAGSEFVHTSVSLRTGVNALYSILSIGYNYQSNFWMTGGGVGTNIILSPKTGLNLDVLYYTLLENTFSSKELNALVQFRPTFNYTVHPRLKVFLGPAVNLYIYNNTESNTLRPNIPYNMYEQHIGDVSLKGWVGVIGGIRF